MGNAVFKMLFLMLAATAATAFWVAVGTPLAMVGAKPTVLESDKLSLNMHLAKHEMQRGAPVFIRIFKEESVLEVWMKRQGEWVKFREFEICKWSGALGPKLREGDGQAPEGFYQVSLGALNPNSSYHLSFNLGYPNRFDQANGRTGSFLMVHGNCVSAGCYAMTDRGIDMIYPLVEAALNHGQRHVPVHIFPFRMSDENMARHAGSKWLGFWNDLRPAYTAFESSKRLPVVEVEQRRYVVRERLGRFTGL
ncbi:MAG: murein L,D-transpeptidase [Alphaproteobacteria bacterium]|nr:murein L,D-transpeptidase [Alphaproteobacteria bacterium]